MSLVKPLTVAAALFIAGTSLFAAAPVFAQGKGGGGGGGGGGGETTLGNNLSVPAVFAEGIGITGSVIDGVAVNTGLRPTATDGCSSPPCFDSASAMVVNGGTYYPQATASTWRADYVDAGPNGTNTLQKVTVAWSDNITGQYWTPRSKVRVETVLSETPADTLKAYNMFSLSGTKRTELFATDGSTYQSSYRTVFSPLAHLTIQKLSGENGDPVSTCFDGAVYQSLGTEGGAGYSAEVNGSGNLIYGYNWDVPSCSNDPTALVGWWRLTFKIDPSATVGTATVNANTELSALAASGALFVPKLDSANNASTLDIKITDTRKGGGKGGKGGGA